MQAYDLRADPGIGSAGLYYYHLFAKALHAHGPEVIKTLTDPLHRWQAEFVADLRARQQRDGSWVNDYDRWLEGGAI